MIISEKNLTRGKISEAKVNNMREIYFTDFLVSFLRPFLKYKIRIYFYTSGK